MNGLSMWLVSVSLVGAIAAVTVLVAAQGASGNAKETDWCTGQGGVEVRAHAGGVICVRKAATITRQAA